MILELDDCTVVVFDLDDTLYKERDFVSSGFLAVLTSLGHGDDAATFELMWRWQRDQLPVMSELARHLKIADPPADLVEVYRSHSPQIQLSEGAHDLLVQVAQTGAGVAMVTDGRSNSQRAKIAALGIGDLLDALVISEEVGTEKPAEENFLTIEAAFPGARHFTYIADNPRKDFVAPNKLGWRTIQLDDDGRNTPRPHPQIPYEFEAHHRVKKLSEIEIVRPSRQIRQSTASG